MNGKISVGEVVPLRRAGHGRADAFAFVPARGDDASGTADPVNVVPFVRPRTEVALTAPELVLPPDLVRAPAARVSARLHLAGFVALSLALHGSLLALLWHEPPPLASIGLEVISVEIVLGATAPAGVATAPGENEVQSASAPEEKSTEPEKTEQKATEQPQDVEVARQETAPEEKTEQPKAEDAKPDVQEFTLLPEPTENPAEAKPEPKPVQAPPPKPVKNAAPTQERRRIAAPTREKSVNEAKASTPSSQANNVGVGRSSNDTNYRGLVSAHLARYKQYPADARSSGAGGTASVTFTIGGGGGVTSVRLAHGSGVASIDQEVQAMVRRASPFPPPPDGRSQSFTVPVNFRLN